MEYLLTTDNDGELARAEYSALIVHYGLDLAARDEIYFYLRVEIERRCTDLGRTEYQLVLQFAL